MRAAPEAVAEHFDLAEPPELSARFNIAPGQAVAVVRATAAGGLRVCEERVWGLLPGWVKDPAAGQRMINARAETLAQKPAFRSAFRRRRCLIPADGFYEWAGGPDGKQPYHIARRDAALFAFAGLWEEWRSEAGESIASCSIVTTRANSVLQAIHERMPVVLDPSDYERWLDPASTDTERLQGLMLPCPDAWLIPRTVGLRVNDVRHDDPACVAEAPPQPRQARLL